jgi:uncharacterized protein
MFPLGSVLLPYMPLALRLFEPRYLQMLGDLLDSDDAQFGVVLIERGHEVGGGDQRAEVGTLARVIEVKAPEGFMAVVATGTKRFEVTQWLEDDPYPRAQIKELPDLEWSDALAGKRDTTETLVRNALRLHNEHGQGWPHDVEISNDPLESSWQLAALVPVGALDQYALLRSQSTEQLLDQTSEFARTSIETIDMIWGNN